MSVAAGSDSPSPSSDAPRPPVGPVMQFCLLIVPVVMTAFFLVYAVIGWSLPARDFVTWATEAESVAVRVGSGIVGYSVLVAAWVWLRGGARRHPLVLSSLAHGVIALLLMGSIFAATRL